MDHSEVKHLPKVDHTPAHLSDVSKTILKAADLIEEKGWIQGRWASSHGYCMRGAVYGVFNNGGAFGDTPTPILGYMESRMPPGQDCMKFNDTPGRTKEEVVSRMRSIALGL